MRRPKDGMKIKVKVLDKGNHRIDEVVNYEITESVCPVCDRKWISLYINGLVVYGGSCATSYKGKMWEHCGQCNNPLE